MSAAKKKKKKKVKVQETQTHKCNAYPNLLCVGMIQENQLVLKLQRYAIKAWKKVKPSFEISHILLWRQ